MKFAGQGTRLQIVTLTAIGNFPAPVFFFYMYIHVSLCSLGMYQTSRFGEGVKPSVCSGKRMRGIGASSNSPRRSTKSSLLTVGLVPLTAKINESQQTLGSSAVVLLPVY